MRYLTILGLMVGCTNYGPLNLANLSAFNENSTISQEAQIQQQQLINRVLTEKEKKEFRKGFEKGKELYKKRKKSGFIKSKAQLFPIQQVNFVGKFMVKNPKVCGVDRKITEKTKDKCISEDFILLLATAYRAFPEFLVFEGLRSREAQRKNVKKGVSKTMNTRHLEGNPLGMAVDILAKDSKGKWSFQAVDRIGMARGVIYAAFLDLQSQGLLKEYKWQHVTLWRFRDAYHIQLDTVRKVVHILWWRFKSWFG